jgi:hypothetical protein
MLFDPPLDAVYVWIGLTVVSLATLGLATALPTTTPPDAAAAGAAIEEVASSIPGTAASVEVRATAVRLAPWRLGLSNRAGSSAADLAFGPVTPARTPALRRVLHGARPATVYDSPDGFDAALRAAQREQPGWQAVDGSLAVRRVSWEGRDATLVG